MTYTEGDHIPVTVNGKAYDTHIINGVQRFVGNPIVEAFMDRSHNMLNVPRPHHLYPEPYDLNQAIIDFYQNKYTLEQMIDFYTLISYSVSGFSDVLTSFEDNLEITIELTNPLWDEED